jgi:hypothetical protein
MLKPIFLDTETCGYYGPVVLIQWAVGDGPVNLWNVWEEPAEATLEIIKMITEYEGGVVGFNMSFDWFHLNKIHNMLRLLPPEEAPIDVLEQAIQAEFDGRLGPCIKPVHTLDLMLHARKGPFQSMMNRKDIIIRRVPIQLAFPLCDELNERIKFDPIYFARLKEYKDKPWRVRDIEGENDFKEIVVQFAPASGLKVLAREALKAHVAFEFEEVALDHLQPLELGYAPFAKILIDGKCPVQSWDESGEWHKPYHGTWPFYIQDHVDHWRFNDNAMRYAEDDIHHTRNLYYYFGSPAMDDDDSILACSVGSVRLHGFSIDKEKLQKQRDSEAAAMAGKSTAPQDVLRRIHANMNEEERFIFGNSTKKVVLEELADWPDHPAAKIAQEVLESRRAEKRIELYDKLLYAGRFHASFNVIGAKSSRMSGTDGLNPQGIQKDTDIRKCFPLRDPGYELNGGDFDAFEVGIADAVYQDPDLRKELMSGRKIHGFFGAAIYPGETYESILASSGTELDLYKRSKSGLFAWLYAGTPFTLKSRLGVPEEQAKIGIDKFESTYAQIGLKRNKVMKEFSALEQSGGTGSKIRWKQPKSYMETLFGFKRFFDLEFRVCKALFDLANQPPKTWAHVEGYVQRDTRDRERVQTVSGATQSSLYGAAFTIQGACARAAINHEIQGTGSGLTKKLQCKLWANQPSGIHPFVVLPMNIHDEVLCPVLDGKGAEIKEQVDSFIKEHQSLIPMLEMNWGPMNTWANKD